jgi:non-ribosomal peptide synthetase component F
MDLSYRKSAILDSSAREVADMLVGAVMFLLQVPQTTTLYDSFHHHMTGMTARVARDFWQSNLAVQERTQNHVELRPDPRNVAAGLRHHDANMNWRGPAETYSHAIQAAWSILAARLANSQDVSYGVLEENPSLPAALMPIRVQVDHEQTLGELMGQISDKMTASRPFERTGLCRIKGFGPESQRACKFATLLVFRSEHEAKGAMHFATEASRSYPLCLQCFLNKEHLRVRFGYMTGLWDDLQVHRLADQFETILHQIQSFPKKTIYTLQVVGPQDLRQICSWNASLPQEQNAVVHHVLSDVFPRRAKATAICAWDGDLTYAELDERSTRLAHQIIDRVGTVESILTPAARSAIPLFFEKSACVPIAALAAMKAGFASVLIDINQPEKRIDSILRQLQPKIALSSIKSGDLARLHMTRHHAAIDVVHVTLDMLNDGDLV